MLICDFCIHYQGDKCQFGLKTPHQMSCRHFDPGMDRFCSDPSDFVSAVQIVQMAGFFGLKGPEMRKVKVMAALEEKTRLSPPCFTPVFPDPVG
jgi:hypothetical protein